MPLDKESLDDLMVLLRDMRATLELEEQLAEGVALLFGFADGERLVMPIPRDQMERLKSKKQELLVLLKAKVDELGTEP